MPIYEYRCQACGFQKEFLQRINAAPMTDCPECGKQTLSKMVTAAGFQLKGSGWYATDFKNKSGAKQADSKTEGKSEDTTKKKDEPKADAAAGAGAGSAAN
ncbi:MAG: zinc ribbon domain-containing protein [Betaproteobacteria bacterium]|jgi:putative FmdB family regulatory protein|nr:zinc ribbon domain-containing protein [Betaproteobacteria bacterium]MDH4293911.1 zinc ribbon domain-containing protein [Betaproteobacteria bacterium]MDH5341706.1 zinc ribbon domain-containing protein [Betaproteobacteria bacterium]